MAAEKGEEEEAKDAQDDKQRHLASERRMKRNSGCLARRLEFLVLSALTCDLRPRLVNLGNLLS